MPEQNPNLPQRGAQTQTLSTAEKRDVIDRMNALQGRSQSFVAEIARQATDARGRLDDDVYGIVRVTLKALAENNGTPPLLSSLSPITKREKSNRSNFCRLALASFRRVASSNPTIPECRLAVDSQPDPIS
jgi:hypothetical protein